jgi:uncharacterized protein with GYD domain
MKTYITLLSYTEQGISTIESSPDRVEAAKELVEEMGGEFKDFYLTFGEYDGVAVAEFPDDETATQYALTLGKAGNARTETLKAFTHEEFEELVEGLPR